MIRFFIFITVCGLTGFSMVKLIKFTNLDIEYRFLQLWHILATLAAVAVCQTLYTPLLLIFNALLSIKWINAFFAFIMPTFHFSLAFMFILLFFSNLLVFIIGVVSLSIARKYTSKMFCYPESGLSKYFGRIANKFYTIEDDSAEITIREKAFAVGKWFNVMRLIFLGLIGLEFFLIIFVLTVNVQLLPAERLEPLAEALTMVIKKFYLLPTAGYLLLTSITYFLQGDAKMYSESLDADNIPSEAVGDYSDLYDALIAKFPESLLFSNRYCDLVEGDLYEDVTEYEIEKAGEMGLALAGLIQTVDKLADVRSKAYRESLSELLTGNSILVYDYPLGDFFPYLTAYVQHILVKGKKVLCVCESAEECNLLDGKYESYFLKANSINKVWNSNVHSDSVPVQEIDVLLCTISDLYNRSSFDRWSELMKDVALVVVNNAVDFFSTLSKYNRDILRARIAQTGNNVQYIFQSGTTSNELGIEIENFLSVDHIKSFGSDKLREICDVIVWRSEGNPQTALSDSRNQLGMELSVCEAALSNGVDRMMIFSSGEAILSAMENLKAGAASINIKTEIINSMNKPFENENVFGNLEQALSFSVFSDRMNNLVKCVDYGRSFGGTIETFVNVVARPYMFRDYFVDKLPSLLSNNAIYSMIIPSVRKKVGEDYIVVLMQMQETGVRMSEVDELLKIYDKPIADMSIWEKLDSFMKVVDPNFAEDPKSVFNVTDYSAFDSIKNCFVINDYIVTLIDEDIYDDICKRCDLAVGYIGGTPHYLWFSAADVRIIAFPQRTISVGQKLYSVTYDERDRLLLTGADYHNSFEEIPIRSYKLESGGDSLKNRVTKNCLSFRRFETKITCETYGFLRLNNGYVFTDHSVDTNLYESPMISKFPCRHICHIGIAAEFEEYNDLIPDKKKFFYTLAMLLNGAFMTLMPTTYEKVRAVPFFNGEEIIPESEKKIEESEDPGESGSMDKIFARLASKTIYNMIGNLEIGEDGDNEAYSGVYILELASIESRCDIFFSQIENWTNIFKALNAYLDWLESAPAEKNWFMFGTGKYPEMVDIPAVKNVINLLSGNNSTQTGTDIGKSRKYVCDFCGRHITKATCLEPHQAGTERYMCAECAEHCLSNEKEIFVLYRQARADMERLYSIKLPKNINVRVKSAKEIKKKTSYSGSGRVLGFYNSKTRSLWVEGGGPREFTISTMYHELTHAWQFNNPKLKNVKKLPLYIIEGQATYIEYECLKKTHRLRFASRLADNYRSLPSGDPYGDGFRKFEQNVPASSKNAFVHMEDGTPINW